MYIIVEMLFANTLNLRNHKFELLLKFSFPFLCCFPFCLVKHRGLKLHLEHRKKEIVRRDSTLLFSLVQSVVD
jgi:hypothetical protein